MYFKFVLLYRNLFFCLALEKRSLRSLMCFPHCDKDWRSFWIPALCVFFSSVWCLFTLHDRPQELSLRPRLTTPLFILFLCPHDVTRATLWTAKKKQKTRRRRRGKKKTCFSHETPLLALSLSLSEAFVRLFQEGETLAGCTAESRLSAVLGNHLSLYWFRCLSLSVSVCHAFCR